MPLICLALPKKPIREMAEGHRLKGSSHEETRCFPKQRQASKAKTNESYLDIREDCAGLECGCVKTNRWLRQPVSY